GHVGPSRMYPSMPVAAHAYSGHPTATPQTNAAFIPFLESTAISRVGHHPSPRMRAPTSDCGPLPVFVALVSHDLHFVWCHMIFIFCLELYPQPIVIFAVLQSPQRLRLFFCKSGRAVFFAAYGDHSPAAIANSYDA